MNFSTRTNPIPDVHGPYIPGHAEALAPHAERGDVVVLHVGTLPVHVTVTQAQGDRLTGSVKRVPDQATVDAAGFTEGEVVTFTGEQVFVIHKDSLRAPIPAFAN